MVISKNSKLKIYHEEDCPYAKRMSKKYQRTITMEKAHSKGYQPCSYCGGIHGLFIQLGKHPTMYGKAREGITESYDRIDRAICFRTPIGFWKVVKKKSDNTYRLYHLNRGCFSPNATDRQLMRRTFHRQADVKGTTKFGKIIYYIHEHDKAKQVMKDDWRKLPKNTNKQKYYYKQAKKREERKQRKRVDELFKKLEKGEL